MEEIPKTLEWVEKRSQCSIKKVFDSLKDEVQSDVDEQNKIPGHFPFEVRQGPSSFTVITEEGGWGIRAVVFALAEKRIEIKNANREIQFFATLTLNDSGRCMLAVDGKELETWQFRRRALETLFFGPWE